MKILRTLPGLAVIWLIGCVGDEPSPAESSGDTTSATSTDSSTGSATDGATVSDTDTSESKDDGELEFQPLTLSGSPGSSGSAGSDTDSAAGLSSEELIQSVMDNLKPLQIMLGQWRGTTRKEFEGFKAVDSHEWIWDLQGDRNRPALAVKSDKSPYLRTARLTWEPNDRKFRLTATDAEGTVRVFSGDYTDPVHEIIGPDDKPHRVFRLELTQTSDSVEKTGGEVWQVAFAQQENNRYLLEVSKRRGSAKFRRYDTVSTQRHGTSFALSDEDYGEKTCIISQGLGTMSVSWKGKSYWVCCSGCKAAFEEDPETWIARAEKRAAEKQ